MIAAEQDGNKLATKDNKQATDADWTFRQTALQFARQGYSIAGSLSAALLTRTAESDARPGDMAGSVRGLAAGAAARSGFVVSVAGTVGLDCQSCGAEFDLPVDSQTTIYVARDAAELASWDDEAFESIEANEKTSALELVEDELLLAVPYVPRCPKCEAGSLDGAPRTHEFN
jgi:uncharacterized protein